MASPYQRLVVIAASGLLACAPLVSYDGFRGGDPDADDDGGGDASAAESDASGAASPESSVESGSNPCGPYIPGSYCGRSLPGYAGRTDDLVRCLGDKTTGSIVFCTSGCAAMPNGRPDVCDPCRSRSNGTYCVHELVPEYTSNDVIVTCAGGAVAAADRCAVVCSGSACR